LSEGNAFRQIKKEIHHMSNTIHSAQTVAYAACVAANVPVLMKGDPGQGKTARLVQLNQAWKRHCEVIVTSSREATDFLGVPVEVDGEIKYLPFGWVNNLNAAPKGSLILDEFSLGSDSTMRATLRVIQERVVGDTPLHEGVSITAIINPVETSAGGMDLMAPVSNRFIHLDWDFDMTLWMDGMVNGFDNVETPTLDSLLAPNSSEERLRLGAIVGQFHQNTGGGHLIVKVPSDPVEAGKPWASPRSWANALDAMAYIPKNNNAARLLVLAGAVGLKVADEFMTFLANTSLPNPSEVIANPNIFDWTGRADISFAVTRSIAAYVRMNVKSDDTLWTRAAEALAVCAAAGKPDVAHAALQSMMVTRPRNAILSETVIDEFRAILGYLPNGVSQETVNA
jgi:hypothetical protein